MRGGELGRGPSHGVTPPPTATKGGQGVEGRGKEWGSDRSSGGGDGRCGG